MTKNFMNLPTAEGQSRIANSLELISGRIGDLYPVSSWEDVQRIVRLGKARDYFEIGDQLVSAYGEEEIIWEIIDFDHEDPVDPSFTHSMTIQTRDCLHNVQFDAIEPNNPDTNRSLYGNNRYTHSTIKQWLNSDEDEFKWVSQHEHDAEPNGSLDIYDGPGFLSKLDPELASVLGPVRKNIAKASVDDGGGEIAEDKVFLLSRLEVGLGSEGTTTGEKVYSFYDGVDNAARIKNLNVSPRHWWLRSPNVGTSTSVRNVYTSGALANYSAYSTSGVSPACVII